MNAMYAVWMQESQAPTSYNPPPIISTRYLLANFHTGGDEKEKTQNLLRYFASGNLPLCASFYFFFYFQKCLLFSFYSSLFLSRQKLTNCISRYSSKTLGLWVYDQKPISVGGNERKKKGGLGVGGGGIRPVLPGEIEGQNVNFPGKTSLVDWTVKRSSNAHCHTR